MTDCAMALAGYFPVPTPIDFVRQWSDRIMYGSDFPILPFEYDREWQKIRSFNLGADVEQRLFYDNAARFFLGEEPQQHA